MDVNLLKIAIAVLIGGMIAFCFSEEGESMQSEIGGGRQGGHLTINLVENVDFCC